MKKNLFNAEELSILENLEILGGDGPNRVIVGNNCTGNNCTGSGCTGNTCTGSNCTGNYCVGTDCVGTNCSGKNCRPTGGQIDASLQC